MLVKRKPEQRKPEQYVPTNRIAKTDPSKRTNLVIDKYALIASICKESFYEFVKNFWDELYPDEKLILNWHIKYLCDELQKVAERVFAGKKKRYDLIINVPPGSTKSTIISIMFPVWTFTRKPNSRHICASHTDTLVLDLSRRCRDLLKSNLYRKCFPSIEVRDDQDTKGYWVLNSGGYRFSCTVGGRTPVGFHGHFLIVDDPIDPDDAVATSEVGLKNANRWMQETLPSRKVNKRISVVILIMQRLHQDDPSGNRLERAKRGKGGKVKHICIPCDDSWPIRPPELRHHYQKNGGMMDRRRLGREVLDELKDSGEFFYAGQYGQNPVPLAGGMFKVTQLIKNLESDPVPPKIMSFRRVVRYWDKAYTGGGGAFTVGVKMGIAGHGKETRFWVLDVVRGQWDSAERDQWIRHTAEQDGYGVRIYVEQEPAAGKESAAGTVRLLSGFRVRTDVRGGVHDGSKIVRADPYASQVNSGNVYLAAAPWNHDYIEELRFFHKSKYKDQVDASSGAFNILAREKRKIGAF